MKFWPGMQKRERTSRKRRRCQVMHCRAHRRTGVWVNVPFVLFHAVRSGEGLLDPSFRSWLREEPIRKKIIIHASVFFHQHCLWKSALGRSRIVRFLFQSLRLIRPEPHQNPAACQCPAWQVYGTGLHNCGGLCQLFKKLSKIELV